MPPELKIIPAPVTFVLNTNCGHDSLLHQYPWPVLTIRSTVSLTAIFCYLKAFCYLQTSDSPYHSDQERKLSKCQRPRSVSMFNESMEKPKLQPASWHQFRCLPPAK